MSLLMMLGKAQTPEDIHKLLEAEKAAPKNKNAS